MREASYSGCGCAGGEVITVRDERGRRKRFYKDVVGRLARVEELKQGHGWASGGCDGGEP
jgi:hypothetical protein